MGEVTYIKSRGAPPKLFNSHLEVGLRVLVILDAFFPRLLDLNEISLFDYFIVHTGDIDGPTSLHPAIASRTGEYLIRRRVIENGINLMNRINLIELVNKKVGIRFQPSESARSVLDLMGTPYNEKLKECAFWLAEKSATSPSGKFEKELLRTLNEWTRQFDINPKIEGVN